MGGIQDDGSPEKLVADAGGNTNSEGSDGGGGTGTQRISGDAIDSSGQDNNRQDPNAVLAPGQRRGQIRELVYLTEELDGANDDIDADSNTDASEDVQRWFDNMDSAHHSQQAKRTTEQETALVGQKELPPLPSDLPPPSSSPPLGMSCRISRFPFSHPCEVPELMPDLDELFGMAPSPPTSGPVTPSIAPDIFRPLTQLTSPDLELGRDFINPTQKVEFHDSVREVSIKSVDTAIVDGLDMIREEDGNLDNASFVAPTLASSGTSTVDGGDRPVFLAADGRGHLRSVSSLGSGSSGEWRPTHARTSSRKSLGVFSRIRHGHRVSEDPCLERRTLTPMKLSAPTPVPTSDPEDEDLSTVEGMAPPLTVLETLPDPPSAASKFLQRIPWVGDSRSGKTPVVFGVDLKESIRVAPMKIRISHKGRSTSYRTFPLALYKCCEFIRRAGGTDGQIFSSPGDPDSVNQLQAIFNTAPTFGEHFRFEGSGYTVHDAARLILVYLESLPKPLISSSVVKSWVLLARQEGAIEPPCPRVETGLDFWTEALNRLPTVNRNLIKHLLTIFAEVLLASSGEISEANARQLASSVTKSIFHQDTDGTGLEGKPIKEYKKKPIKRDVQPTLALAFLIKKRGEYAVSLSEVAKTDGSKRNSTSFLPSTKEIMEWKGSPR
ncbi:hypothetical protein B0J18DRAFT_66956 [Chaetomium sp. MPI-SDFR-AT-0129]|nr:hypothetical protein B0J18DRAFT_66956 [Chaetomium sp. MPI-SDFR-AT-0129]